ncbi:MAG: PepSY domain-containing protein [Planctomycetaceae bacterium]|nr:PepSY domain-containing protein [Planctomycetaceae bacterium]
MTSLIIPVQLTAILTAAILLSICLVSLAKCHDTSSPNRDLPLAEIVGRLEKEGYGTFREISRDDGHWEVEVYRHGITYKLTVDPKSCEVLSEHRSDSKPLPSIGAKPVSKGAQLVPLQELLS